MTMTNERQINQAAFRRLRDSIKQKYPVNRFLALAGGQIIADAASFPELQVVLKSNGYDVSDVLVVQAGAEYPDTATIFAQAFQS